MISPPDWLWPNAHGKGEREPKVLCALGHASTEKHLDFIERELREAEGRERARDQSVQNRLIALLSLSSSLATLTTGLLGLALSSIRIELTHPQLGAIVAALSYLALQFIAATLHTASGLMPRTFQDVAPVAFDPHPRESAQAFRRELLSTHRSNLGINRWSTNRRMDEMTFAVVALRNASVGTAVLIAVGLVTILNHHFGVCLPLPEWLAGLTS